MIQFPSMVELAQELSARGDYTSAQILTQLLKSHDDLQTENAALKLQAANSNLHSLQSGPDHMARLCALAHSAVSLMILPPFARDAHKLRADGTLETLATKDMP